MKRTYLILSILTIGFFTNLVWENAQAFLYEDYPGFLSHFLICFLASIVDAFAVLLLYLVFALVYQNMYWLKSWDWKPLLLLIIAGGILAVGFEKWVLARGEWDYADTMPIVPLLNVGLSPLLQLMILPILTYYVSYKIVK